MCDPQIHLHRHWRIPSVEAHCFSGWFPMARGCDFMATDPQSLLTAATCYDCYLPQAWLLKLGLLKQILLNQNAMADTTPQGLITAAQCYDCPPLYALYELGLLQQIVANGSAGGGGGGATIFTAGAGVAPAAAPTSTGQIALNKSTNDLWVSPDGVTWQLVIGP